MCYSLYKGLGEEFEQIELAEQAKEKALSGAPGRIPAPAPAAGD